MLVRQAAAVLLVAPTMGAKAGPQVMDTTLRAPGYVSDMRSVALDAYELYREVSWCRGTNTRHGGSPT